MYSENLKRDRDRQKEGGSAMNGLVSELDNNSNPSNHTEPGEVLISPALGR